MHQLKLWGFSAESWRGARGEYWVLAQAMLLVVFLLLPIGPSIGEAKFLRDLVWYMAAGLGAIGLGLGAIVLLVAGVVALGRNLTPLPHPRDDASLVTTGIYAVVRHPIYSGVILGAIAYSLWQLSLFHGLGALVLFGFFDQKAKREEVWLASKFSDYPDYQTKVKKLIPGLY